MRARAVLLSLLAPLLAAPAANGAITATRDAGALGQAIVKDASTLRGAAFHTIAPDDVDNPNDNPAGTIDAALAGLPTDGPTAAILSSGNVELADDPNDSEGSGEAIDPGGVTRAGRGDSAYDVVVLRLDVTVPQGANCLSLNFKFLSEEYPEYVGLSFNDAFLAEVDETTWTTSQSEISAPGNFAFDPLGKVISINATGDTSVDPQDAAGTTYDAATQILIARRAITPGDHSIFLSVFDQGDPILDATAIIDRLEFLALDAARCRSGAVVDENVAPASVSAALQSPCSRSGAVDFTVTDNPRGSGPLGVHYRLDGGPEQFVATEGNPGKATVTVPPGAHTIEYWGEDRNGNQETPHKTASLTVDPVAPVVSVAGAPTGPVKQGQLVNVTVTASDAISGLAVDPSGMKALDTSTPGARTATYTATDRCGNSATQTVSYTVTRVRASSIFSAPGTKKCISRRNFPVRVRKVPGLRFVRGSIKVGKRKAVPLRKRKGRLRGRVDLRGTVGKQRIPVQMTVVTAAGTVFTDRRAYLTCTPKRRR